MPNMNPDCSGSFCQSATGEVRVLPIGKESNAILCRACYNYEIKWRKRENRRLAPDSAYRLPSWDSLKVYAS